MLTKGEIVGKCAYGGTVAKNSMFSSNGLSASSRNYVPPGIQEMGVRRCITSLGLVRGSNNQNPLLTRIVQSR
jgi:hypothetical protein